MEAEKKNYLIEIVWRDLRIDNREGKGLHFGGREEPYA